jgi:hypothetical protein
MDILELLGILRHGEGPSVEFKIEFPKQAHNLAKEMAALANSGGGLLLIGIDDEGTPRGISEPNRAAERLANIARSCSPPLWPQIDKIYVSKDVCIVYAKIPSCPPCFYQGKIYVRVGSTSVECSGGDEFRVILSNMNNPASQPAAQMSRSLVHKERTQRQGPTIASIEDVLDWNWNGGVLLDRLISLDYATIPGLTADNEGQSEQWAPVFMEHPDTWRLLIDGAEHIVGYWHFVPLFDAEYQLAKEGLLFDGDITSDKLCYFELPGFYNIYFVSISLLPNYRGVRNFRLLLDSLFEQFTELAARNIYFKEVCANAFTESGESLCKTLEMQFIGQHKDHGKLFIKTFSPLPSLKIFQLYPEFVDLYSNLTEIDLKKFSIGQTLRPNRRT